MCGSARRDFQQAKRLLVYLAKRGLDLGESSALALYAVLQMVNFGIQGNYLVVVVDGIEKYERSLSPESGEDLEGKLSHTRGG